MIRAIVDANVLISHLLNPAAHRPPNRIVNAGIAREFNLVLVETTLNEMTASVQAKPYLATRIDSYNLAQFESSLRLSVTVIPESIDNVPQLTRDPGDDYLISHAIIERLTTSSLGTKTSSSSASSREFGSSARQISSGLSISSAALFLNEGIATCSSKEGSQCIGRQEESKNPDDPANRVLRMPLHPGTQPLQARPYPIAKERRGSNEHQRWKNHEKTIPGENQ